MDLRPHKLPKPFCDLSATAYFLGLTYNQAEGRWKSAALPRALAQDGSVWMPAGRKLVNAAELYPLLDEVGRELFEHWQNDELRIPVGAANDGNRDSSVRELSPRELPPHGTTARFEAGCRCGECRGARAAYMRSWNAKKNDRPRVQGKPS